MTERFAHNMAPIRMDHAIIRPSQSLVKGGGPAAQFRLSDARSLSEAARRTSAEQQDEAWAGALRIES